MVRLNVLLRDAGIAPEETAVILHTPKTPTLRRRLPWLAAERPDIFNAYQSIHSDSEGATLKTRRFLLSFVWISDGRQVFVSAYNVEGWEDWDLDRLDGAPAFAALAEMGDVWASAYARERGRSTHPVFTLTPHPALRAYSGRLVIAKPSGRRLNRLAENLDAEVLALSETSLLVSAPPAWRDFIVTGPELRDLPRDWAARLKEWRGIYLIVDEVDGARYVGAAYGAENLLGRWRTHVAGDRGVTRDLTDRDPMRFRFSILELLAPTATIEEVTAMEQTWMDRLHTKQFGLNA